MKGPRNTRLPTRDVAGTHARRAATWTARLRSTRPIPLLLAVLALGQPFLDSRSAAVEDSLRPSARLYVTAFKSRSVDAFRLSDGSHVRSIQVDDAAGTSGIAASRDGTRLFVLDGPSSGRLRVLDTSSWQETATITVDDRLLLLGGSSVLHLTADDRWLLLRTFDYGAAASGVRVFDVERGVLLPLGLRDRPCDSGDLGSSLDGSLIAVCPGSVRQLVPLAAVRGEFLSGKGVPLPVGEPVAIAVASAAGKLFGLERARDGAGWRVLEWKPGDERVSQRKVELLAGTRPSANDRVELAASDDGRRLAISGGSTIWVVDATTLETVRTISAPGELAGVAFVPGSEDLVGLASTPDRASAATIVYVPPNGAQVQLIDLSGFERPEAPLRFVVASDR